MADLKAPVVTPPADAPKVEKVVDGTPPPVLTKTEGSSTLVTEVSLLDGAEGAKKIVGEAPKVDDKTKTEPKPGEAPKGGPPEKYTLAIPKDSLLQDADLPRIEALSRTRGLTQEQAQAFVEAQSELLSVDAKAEQERFGQLQKEWKATITADPVLGNAKLPESMEAVKRYVEDPKKFPVGLKKILVDSGLHNHPEVFRFLHGLAAEGKNDKVVVPPGGGAPTDQGNKPQTADQRMVAMYEARAKAEKAKLSGTVVSE